MKQQLKAFKSIRKTWGELNPITRVIKDKTKFTRKTKFKKMLDI